MAKTTKKGEASAEATKEAQKPANVLLGTISYSDDNAYEEFLKKMDINQAVFVLVAAANFSQARGAFSLPEGELINTAIRTIKKSSAPANAAPEQPTTSAKK